MSFLPSQYEVPQSGLYMKFLPGKNRFRVLAPAIVGNLFWHTTPDGKEPVRRHVDEPIHANELEVRDGKIEKPKHFWAFPVWNYAAKAVQILEVTQKTIMQSMQALVEEPDWGDPQNYDIIVSRSGSGLETEYAVQPAPAKPLDPDIEAARDSTPINLDALYVNGDPFGAKPAKKPSGNGKADPNSPKSQAWKQFCVKTSDMDKDTCADAFLLATEQHFGKGFEPSEITAEQWAAFVKDLKADWNPIRGFPMNKRKQPLVENPITEERDEMLADAPF